MSVHDSGDASGVAAASNTYNQAIGLKDGDLSVVVACKDHRSTATETRTCRAACVAGIRLHGLPVQLRRWYCRRSRFTAVSKREGSKEHCDSTLSPSLIWRHTSEVFEELRTGDVSASSLSVDESTSDAAGEADAAGDGASELPPPCSTFIAVGNGDGTRDGDDGAETLFMVGIGIA